MRAAVFHEAHQPMTIPETLEVAKPQPHEVLLCTAYAGLCHSDLHFVDGLYPIQTPCVLGHDLWRVAPAHRLWRRQIDGNVAMIGSIVGTH